MIIKGQRLGIGLGEAQRVAHQAAVQQLVPAFNQHRVVDVGQHNPALGAGCFGKGGCQIARSAGQVQHRLAGAHVCQINGEAFPQAMNPQRHQVIHQVVITCYRGKHLAHPFGFLANRHLLVTKMGCIGLVIRHRRHYLSGLLSQGPGLSRF